MTERAEPIGLTIDDGRFVVRERVQGEGTQQLWLGTEVATNAGVLIAADHHYNRVTVDEVRERVEPDGPGIAALVFVGGLDPHANDGYRNHWVTVETAPGRWLPRVVQPRLATRLGASAARMLDARCQRGQVLDQVRPDLMWATDDGDSAEVTAVSTRAVGLFSLARPSRGGRPVFATRYIAPEARADEAAQANALVYSLGVMVAEWASGYPYATAVYGDYGPQPRDLALPMDVPDELERLLRRAIDRDPAQRPSLDEFAALLGRTT